ncbi:MAG TPA: hydrogen peroxide-inducible genes activator [Gammaproteobacteria bacterium]|nr:hydrogen peroxide-inducible genes activator [Gammaproteobacteria bacterium]
MTLTELRYIVAVARERHFGRAAQACFVSQPTLSVAIRKLEEELGVTLFERGTNEVTPTPVGERIVTQAQRVLEQTAAIKEIAQHGKDPLAGPLRLGVIYTVGPYLLPHLIPLLHKRAPRMPLLIEENYTARLSELLKEGVLDVIVISLPFDEPGVVTQVLYDEPFKVVLPFNHEWKKLKTIKAKELAKENLLLLGAGHCFRDQVLKACPGLNRSSAVGSLQRTLEGSSLETIRHMVASGAGITVLPCTSVLSHQAEDKLLTVRPFADPVPKRRIALAWRNSFTRPQAIGTLREALHACPLPCVNFLDLDPVQPKA